MTEPIVASGQWLGCLVTLFVLLIGFIIGFLIGALM
jgi:UPF0716 family protein affecting phage T7 exclusion